MDKVRAQFGHESVRCTQLAAEIALELGNIEQNEQEPSAIAKLDLKPVSIREPTPCSLS